MAKILIDTVDPRNKSVSITKNTYYGHIIKQGHTDISLSDIKNTIEDPDYIYKDRLDDKRENFYKQKASKNGKNAYTKLVTEKVSESISVCVTAFTANKIKEDQNNEIYHR